MSGREELEALARRVEELGDITCPLCGETGFDAPGFSVHIFQWCAVEKVNNYCRDNAEVAAALRTTPTPTTGETK